MNYKLLAAVLFTTLISIHYNAIAQEKPENIDTIYIHKEPVVIVKKVYVEEEKITKKHRYSLGLTIGVFGHFDTYTHKNEAISLTDYGLSYEVSNIPSTGYLYHVTLDRYSKRFFYGAGIGCVFYREVFENQTLSGLFSTEQYRNSYSYASISLHLGYLINLQRSSLQPWLGFEQSLLMDLQGTTLSPENNGTLIDLKDSEIRRQSVSRVNLGMKYHYGVSPRWGIHLGIAYAEDITSTLNSEVSFSLRWHRLGFNTGVTHTF